MSHPIGVGKHIPKESRDFIKLHNSTYVYGIPEQCFVLLGFSATERDFKDTDVSKVTEAISLLTVKGIQVTGK